MSMENKHFGVYARVLEELTLRDDRHGPRVTLKELFESLGLGPDDTIIERAFEVASNWALSRHIEGPRYLK
ncbi:MAG: hypothetical protein M1115_01915 [Actinobacteria bacterium]|nr:hypothetical protein [Actinomycetota bacterium]